MKKVLCRLLLFFIICFIFVQSCKKAPTTQSMKADSSLIYHKGVFVGILGKDSIYIDSKPFDDDIRIEPIIYLGNEVIYNGTENNSLFLIEKSESKVFSLLNNDYGYILLTTVDPPYEDKWFVLKLHDKKVIKAGYAIKQVFNDIDNDGYYEIGGRELTDAICLHCDSILYQPYVIYKLNEKFELDSIISKTLTTKLYGAYLGMSYIDTVLLRREYIDWNHTKLDTIPDGG